jgi:hypothetical protein
VCTIGKAARGAGYSGARNRRGGGHRIGGGVRQQMRDCWGLGVWARDWRVCYTDITLGEIKHIDKLWKNGHIRDGLGMYWKIWGRMYIHRRYKRCTCGCFKVRKPSRTMDSTQFYSLCVCRSCSCVGGVKCEAFRNIGNRFFFLRREQERTKI